jgi:predicted signal transduction protein with EAL and GGDEF domain
MAKAAAKKRADVENELMTHVDIISDPKVREYIKEKKEAKLAAKRER